MAKPASTQKTFSKYKNPLTEMPNLVENQIESYNWFLEKGIKEAIGEFSPITDYADKKFELTIDGLTLQEPEFDEHYARENKRTYETGLKARVRLHNKTLNETKEQEIFLTEVPMMTAHGTFVINGVERVIVPQLARSTGVFFTSRETRKGTLFGAKVIPARGSWVEFETGNDGVLYVRIDKKRKFAITSLLRVMGLGDEKEMKKTFAEEHEEASLALALAKDPAKNTDESYVEIYRKLRDGEMATLDNAKEYVNSIFSEERYDLSRVGRYRFNRRFDLDSGEEALKDMRFTLEDLIHTVRHAYHLNNTPGSVHDDIDDLALRRVRFVGELVQQKVRKGMSQMKRNIQDKMSTIDSDTTLPIKIVNQRPLQARVKEFYATNQLSQFMNQENALSEISHLRSVTALGNGGLTRERAGFEVRDVHTSHYGRVCPIHTPEGPNIGLILRLAVYARINEFGVIETPYVRVTKGKITGEIVYLNAREEDRYVIAHAATDYNEKGKIIDEYVTARAGKKPKLVNSENVDFIDVATNQAFSVATSLIPFLEHNDASRALMGSNMQKQAMPCICPEAPLVATGMEKHAVRDTGRVILAANDGVVVTSDAKEIVVKYKGMTKDKKYSLLNFTRTNAYSLLHQRPVVNPGDSFKKGDVLADTSTSDRGQLAIGQNIFIAFMCWRGQNYEDAIIVSERLVKNSVFTSVRVEEYECVVRDTKLGPEITTHDIPNVSEAKLRNLDIEGIVRVGAEVHEGDILVGKITPKGETELTPEERLLRSIFGEKSRDVKDTSLRIGNGKYGRVVGVKVFSREQGHNLESGVLKKIYIEISQLRNIQVGDKLAGRHGNKGVISVVLPEEDMPYMADGTPIDMILTPLGVPSRMNLGQILELHLGMAANTLGYQAIVPAFGGANPEEIKEELAKAGLPEDGKVTLFDGRTGEAFDQPIAVGYMYILKLSHMIQDKMHARSVGPYSLITQQPLGGKSQNGGQRFGEMEVWALQGYGAAHTLREMLTIKSDDIQGRSAAFDAIIKGQRLRAPGLPASFNVLLKYLKGLCLDVQLSRRADEEEIIA